MSDKKITIGDVEALMKGLFAKQIDHSQTRAYVIGTGEYGMKMFDRSIRLQYLTPKLDNLLAQNVIADNEFKSLSKMLLSSDDETFTLAEKIITMK